VPNAALLCLVFVGDDFASQALHVTPNELKLLNGFIGLFTFVCVLVQLVWKPDSLVAAHAHAAEHYARFDHVSSPLDTRFLPPLPAARITEFQRVHFQRLEMARRLETDPWAEVPRRR